MVTINHRGPPLDRGALRAKTEAWMEKTGKTLTYSLPIWAPSQHRPAPTSPPASSEVAHFNMLRNDGFPTVDACADAAVKSGAPVVVICSTDATYPEIVPELARKIRAAKPDTTVPWPALPPRVQGCLPGGRRGGLYPCQGQLL